jgi:putative membrane protein
MGLIWLLLIAAAVYIIYKSNDGKQAGTSAEPPLEIAKKRYARGEMTHEEFEQMKKDLQ